jgi:hypothetical protein
VTPGVYNFTIDAANGISPSAAQHFTLTVSAPPVEVSLTFSGLALYTNSGPLTSGGFTITPSTGVITSITGTGTIVGLKGGSATIVVNVHRFVLGNTITYSGWISVSDPSAHFNATASVMTTNLTRNANGEVSGSAFGLFYTVKWTL